MLPYEEGNTTAVVREYVAQLAQLPTDIPQDAIVRELLGRAVGRLHLLCATVLYQRYPRLTQAPLNLQARGVAQFGCRTLVEGYAKSSTKRRPTVLRVSQSTYAVGAQ